MNFLFTFLIISAGRTREVDEKLNICQYNYKKNYTSLLPRTIIMENIHLASVPKKKMFALWLRSHTCEMVIQIFWVNNFPFCSSSYLDSMNGWKCVSLSDFFMFFSKFCCCGKFVLSHTRSKQKWNEIKTLIGTSELNELNLN